jgi:hypothetical protein
MRCCIGRISTVGNDSVDVEGLVHVSRNNDGQTLHNAAGRFDEVILNETFGNVTMRCTEEGVVRNSSVK